MRWGEGILSSGNALRSTPCSSPSPGPQVKSLELLTNSRTGDSKASLFGVLHYTRTAVGTRLLRANILSPCNELATLHARLDAVSALLGSEDTYTALGDALPRLADFDALLSFCVASPRVHTPATSRQAVAAILRLRQTLALLPQVADALGPDVRGHSALLERIHEALASAGLEGQRAALDAALTEEAAAVRSPHQRAVQECFAVRPGRDGHLDAMRRVRVSGMHTRSPLPPPLSLRTQIYVDTTTEIGEVVERYRVEWGMPSLKLHHTASRGHHLQVSERIGQAGGTPRLLLDTCPLLVQLPASAEATGLPPGLMQAVKTKSCIAASTEELTSLNDRAKESIVKMYRCTHLVLQDLIAAIRAEIAPLYRVAESVALLDMLRAFACFVAEAPNSAAFTRPTFSRCA